MATQATLIYLVSPYSKTTTELAAEINSSLIPIDPSYFVVTSTSLTSDVTAVSGGKAVRTVTVNLAQPPVQLAPGNRLATVPYTPSVYSSSPLDTYAGGGTGARTVQLQYLDQAGGAHTENINLNGTTPVSAVGTNYFTLTGFQIVAAGSALANQGIIYITAPTAKLLGAAVGTKVYKTQSTTVLAIVDASFYVKYPSAAGYGSAFQAWLTNAIKAQVGSCQEATATFS